MICGLATRQAAAGHDVRWVTTWPGHAVVPGVEVTRVSGWRRVAAALAGAEVVHVHGVDPLLELALWARPPGAAIGVSTHGLFLHGRRGAWLRAAALHTWARLALARADAVWFTSEVDRAAVAPTGVGGEVVPDGVDVAALRGVVRRPSSGRWVVPGRVDHHKGHTSLLRALVAAWRLGARFEVDVVGRCADGGLAAALRREARPLGDAVRWRGEVDGAAWREAVATAELALFPSEHESFGLAVVEAMAMGVAPVVSPILAHRLLVREGVTGSHVDFAAPTAGARLASLREVDRRPLDAAARAAAEAWSWEAVMPQWEAAYDRL